MEENLLVPMKEKVTIMNCVLVGARRHHTINSIYIIILLASKASDIG